MSTGAFCKQTRAIEFCCDYFSLTFKSQSVSGSFGPDADVIVVFMFRPATCDKYLYRFWWTCIVHARHLYTVHLIPGACMRSGNRRWEETREREKGSLTASLMCNIFFRVALQFYIFVNRFQVLSDS